MKAPRFTLLLAVLSVGAAFYGTACHDENNVSGPRQSDFEIARFAIIDFSDVENGIEDASTETEMTFNNAMLEYTAIGGDKSFGPDNPGLRGMRWFDRFDFRNHLGFIFVQLNLTNDQKSEVRRLATTFHDNMKPLVRLFYDANHAFIESANASRTLIMDRVKSGSLTREEAAVEIRALNQATRDKINANPASQRIKAAMCSERSTLFAGVGEILQAEQVAKWREWIAKVRNPCAS